MSEEAEKSIGSFDEAKFYKRQCKQNISGRGTLHRMGGIRRKLSLGASSFMNNSSNHPGDDNSRGRYKTAIHQKSVEEASHKSKGIDKLCAEWSKHKSLLPHRLGSQLLDSITNRGSTLSLPMRTSEEDLSQVNEDREARSVYPRCQTDSESQNYTKYAHEVEEEDEWLAYLTGDDNNSVYIG